MFVSIATALPAALVWSLRDNLQLPHVTPLVYHGVPKPVGQTVSNVFIEARNELLSSDIVVLVLAADASGHVSDDWSLSFIHELKARGTMVRVYLVPFTEPAMQWISWSDVQADVTSVTSVKNAEDAISLVTSDIAALVRSRSN